ncbi:phosphopentomutase [Thermohalobacter berrensis]|uniref:Phosphopentomutase n=2 Tax=Thermohalobacter berrensis TaxID=99594 RepID=A0A419TAQ1_9FIRM|nr:phosphopentomutase [Thermohalobacter berrensis]
MINRVILIVLDSVGVGELPDAKKYGDEGSDTLDNISKYVGGLRLPNLERMGLGLIEGVTEINKTENPIGSYGRSNEKSAGKDTTTGHWEISGLILDKPFPTYPNGFPDEIILKFEEAIGTKILGNKPASGTKIIEELGEEHIKTGYPIVYTSADSVFQIAAHEDVIPVKELYKMCKIARGILTGNHNVGRVIARPFIGEPGNFTRTARRKDFALKPPGKTILDIIKDISLDVLAVGKIEDIFAGKGITESIHTKDNMDGVDRTIQFMKEKNKGLIFTNLVDFDMKYGHRNDPVAYGNALKEFDDRLPEILESMNKDDVLIITADHGCDPTTESTDHSREYIPILVYGEMIKKGVNIGTRKTYADIGATILDMLNIGDINTGTSFADLILK